METNPQLDDITVTDRPKNHTTTGEIVEIVKGTRAELYDLEEGEEPRYGSRDDEILSIQVKTSVNGTEYTVFEDIRFYENPSDRSNIGKFVKRYGTPEVGIEVSIDFDEDGDASIIL